jgi:hypothetical protein
VPRRSNIRRAPGDLGTPYSLHMMGGPMTPVHMVAGRMWIDPKAGPQRVTVLVENVDDDVRAVQMLAVLRKSGWRVYADLPLDLGGAPGDGSRATEHHFLWTSGPLDPRDRDIVWSWGWKSKSAKALIAAEALM